MLTAKWSLRYTWWKETTRLKTISSKAATRSLRPCGPAGPLTKGDVDKTLGHIASKAREKGVVVVEADRRKLDFMSQTHAHQGVIALAGVREYCQISDILALAEQRQEPPFVIVCDEISDPHNLGAIIRSAECAGAHGIIIPKRRSAGLTAIVDKASAGAAEHALIARVPNISAAIKELKE